jgi:hypothetical protein
MTGIGSSLLELLVIHVIVGKHRVCLFDVQREPFRNADKQSAA